MILGDGPRWLRGTRVPRPMSVRILSRARFAPSDVPKPDARNFGQHFLRPLLTRMSMEAPAALQLIGFLRWHLIDVLAQLLASFTFTNGALGTHFLDLSAIAPGNPFSITSRAARAPGLRVIASS